LTKALQEVTRHEVAEKAAKREAGADWDYMDSKARQAATELFMLWPNGKSATSDEARAWMERNHQLKST
jgi:hypothetical protein